MNNLSEEVKLKPNGIENWEKLLLNFLMNLIILFT